MPKSQRKVRNLAIVLGDQLDRESPLLVDFDKKQDVIWMAEVDSESTRVWSHKARIAVFLSAMRHFRDELLKKGFEVHYRQLNDERNRGTLAAELETAVKELKPERLRAVQPGEYRVEKDLTTVAKRLKVPIEILEDTHFLCSLDEFREHAEGRRQLRMEFFYREMRKRHGILMDGDKPEGGSWNYDQENRETFSKKGPQGIPQIKRRTNSKLTREVLKLVEDWFPDHPGKLDHFNWPVTPKAAGAALNEFIEHALPDFGRYQDAMWSSEPFLFHSKLSCALNLKLLNPRKVIAAAEDAYHSGKAPLNSVEGFIRQILGWREYVRGVYWLHMPGYLRRNELKAKHPLPKFYWTGDTEMNCLREAITQTLDYGYAHHIQRLMVTGLFSLLLGVKPQEVHEWYLAVYADAVEWVELPNTLGMSQYADGGIMASKPYVATGKYISRMSNYCESCRFNPAKAIGDDACPFTTLYWDFLLRHREELEKNNRMSLQLRILDRKSSAELSDIQSQATQLKESMA